MEASAAHVVLSGHTDVLTDFLQKLGPPEYDDRDECRLRDEEQRRERGHCAVSGRIIAGILCYRARRLGTVAELSPVDRSHQVEHKKHGPAANDKSVLNSAEKKKK